MKRFLRNIVLWFGPVLVLYFLIIAINAGPTTDYQYHRFTRPKAPSLITGTSRAAQGIIPGVLDSLLADLNYRKPLFNYTFTIYQSPYGPCYLDALKRKFTQESGGLFIVTVDPFSVSVKNESLSSEAEELPECDMAPSNIRFPEMNPNFEYLLKNYWNDLPRLTGFKNEAYETYVADDGWLEVNFPFDTVLFRRNAEEKLEVYRELVQSSSPSEARWEALSATVDYFGEYGRVVLLRLPVPPPMRRIEEEYYPGFDERIRALAEDKALPYLDHSAWGNRLHFTDGNHLHHTAAKKYSAELAADIRNLGEIWD